jgi:hypothetical protein
MVDALAVYFAKCKNGFLYINQKTETIASAS